MKNYYLPLVLTTLYILTSSPILAQHRSRSSDRNRPTERKDSLSGAGGRTFYRKGNSATVSNQSSTPSTVHNSRPSNHFSATGRRFSSARPNGNTTTIQRMSNSNGLNSTVASRTGSSTSQGIGNLTNANRIKSFKSRRRSYTATNAARLRQGSSNGGATTHRIASSGINRTGNGRHFQSSGNGNNPQIARYFPGSGKTNVPASGQEPSFRKSGADPNMPSTISSPQTQENTRPNNAEYAAGLSSDEQIYRNENETPAYTPANTSANAPLDGGVSVLLVAGAAAGIRKAYQKRKQANNRPD